MEEHARCQATLCTICMWTVTLDRKHSGGASLNEAFIFLRELNRMIVGKKIMDADADVLRRVLTKFGLHLSERNHGLAKESRPVIGVIKKRYAQCIPAVLQTLQDSLAVTNEDIVEGNQRFENKKRIRREQRKNRKRKKNQLEQNEQN
jgi:hypothetical protein